MSCWLKFMLLVNPKPVFFHSYQTQSLATFLPKKVYGLMSSNIELPFEIYKACVKFTLRGLGIFNDFIFCRWNFFSVIVTKKIWYCSHHLFHWNYEKLSGLSEKKFQAKQKNRKYWFILWKNTRSQWLILNLFAALTLILIFTNLYLSLL